MECGFVCRCGFASGTEESFLRHVLWSLQSPAAPGGDHQLVGGGLPELPPPRKGSVTATLWKRRLQAESIEVPFTCQECGFGCGTQAALESHIASSHTMQQQVEEEEKSGECEYKCSTTDDRGKEESLSEVTNKSGGTPQASNLMKEKSEQQAISETETPPGMKQGPVAAVKTNSHTESPAWLAASNARHLSTYR